MKKPMIHNNHQSGQAILLIAMLMVALIASLGLAIDGGGMFLMHRDVQNATDASALSAAFALCTGGDPIEAGENSAALNGFVDGVDDATVTIVNPPPTGESHAGDDDYVFIKIEQTKPAYFIQVVYPSPLIVSAQTISQCSPASEFGWPTDSATISLSTGCAAGNGNTAPNRTTGGSSYSTVGGGMYINSSSCSNGGAVSVGGGSIGAGGYGICSQGSGSSVTGNASITATEGGTVANTCGADYPQIPAGTDPYVDAGLQTPTCSGAAQTLSPTADVGDSATYNQPGNYSSFDATSGTTMLAPGIYCITDTAISIKAPIANIAADGGVFLFFNGTDDLTSNGGSPDMNLHAITDDDSDYTNLLMWFHDPGSTISNSSAVSFTAQGSGQLTGTIYAPRKHCNLAGGAGVVVFAQMICYSFDNNGGSGVEIHFNPSLVYSVPAEFGITE